MASPKSPAIVSGETVEEIARHTVRWTSLGVLAVSFIGAIMAFNGQWPTSWRVWEQVSLIAAVAGVVLQGFCTLMEWANRKKRLSPQYLGPLLIDIGSTYIGFAPLLVPIFQRGLQRALLPLLAAQIIAHIAVVVLAWWFAYYPEQNLVKE
jgi:hypothetical protein